MLLLGFCSSRAEPVPFRSISPSFPLFQRISLRQNLLSHLFYHPLPAASTSAGQTLASSSSDPSSAAPVVSDAPDEDPLDDADAAKKEADYPYEERRRAEEEEPVWPLRGLKQLEELDLYDNSLKSVKGLEGLDSLTCVASLSLLFLFLDRLEDGY